MRYLFGGFELDASQYELRRGGVPLHVEPRVLDLLFYLVRNRDRIITRQELFDNLWEEKFIGESALSRCVAEARKAITLEGLDDPIKTIHRRGYRFVVPVTEEENGTDRSTAVQSEPATTLNAVAEAGPTDAQPEAVIPPEPAPARSNRRVSFALGIVIAASLVLIAFAAFTRSRRAAPPAEAALRVSPDLKITRLTTSGKATDAAISPDGRFLAYVLDERGARSIRLRQIATDSDRELLPAVSSGRKSLTFTPDGHYVTYLEQDAGGSWALHRITALGGTPQRLVESVQDSAWSNRKDTSFATNGDRVAFVRRLSPSRTALYIHDLRSHEERQILARDGELFRPLWTPDEQALICHLKLPGYSTEIRLVEVSLETKKVVRESMAAETPLFVGHGILADRRHIIGVGGRSLGRTAIHLASYPAMLLTPVTQGTSYWQSPSVTADGRQLVAVRVQENYNLWTAALGESDQRKVTSDLDAMEGTHGIDVTADGEFVYTSRTNGEHNHVWIASGDGRHLRQLTSGTEDEYWPVASPSGKTIFYGQRQTADKKRSMRIWRMDIASGRSTPITSGSWDMLPVITPDGRWIIYTDGGAETPVIKRVPSTGGKPETITSGIVFAPSISPDGKLLAGFHARTMSDLRTLVTMRVDDGSIVHRFPIAGRPGKLCVRWAPDGQGLLVVRESAGVGNLWLYPLAGTPPTQLSDFASLQIQAFNLLPGGNGYVFSRGQDVGDVLLLGNLLSGEPPESTP
jgi:DNA-binding winged helix-turn-helix (wHTH) protein/Tol biopolymer transport system component